jgi:hypothetical protein
MSKCRYASSTRLCALILARCAFFVIVAAAVCFAGSKSIAAQITFAFDATVTEISATPGFADTFPFMPSVGQAMSGKVTFTPVAFGQMSDNDAKLEIAWEGETFIGASNTLFTTNNYGGPLGSPIDALSVSCRVSQDCNTPSFSITVRELALLLKSYQDVVPGGQLTDSVNVWNQFEDRQILLFLSNADDTKRVSALAVVGPMRLIPEPGSAALVCFGVGLVGTRRPRDWLSELSLCANPLRSLL